MFLSCNVILCQEAKNSSIQTADWKSLTPEIETALQKQMKMCNDERRWTALVQTADVTGDGVPEALVEYCHMGAYTSEAALLQLVNGNPVPARFRDRKANSTEPGFLRGASVKNGENTALIPEDHAVYAIHWQADDTGLLRKCTLEAYAWRPKSGTFDRDPKLSIRLARRECRKVQAQLDCQQSPCPK